MIKDLWLNLPVKDVEVSRRFFEAIGFPINDGPGQPPNTLCLLIGNPAVPVMLFPEATFEGFSRNKLSNPKEGSEILISVGIESPAAIDSIAARVEAAGGKVFSAPQTVMGNLYGCGFIDPDGHRWNLLWMDN